MIRQPVLIIGCPRSGTTLLFNVLSEAPSLWSIGYESKSVVERYHSPAVKGWESGALDASDVTPESRRYMLRAWERGAAPGTFWRRLSSTRARLGGSAAWRAVKRRGRTQSAGAGLSSGLPQQGLDAVRAFVRARNTLLPPRAPVRLVEKTPENCLRLPFLLELFPDARVVYLTRDGRSNVHSLMEGWLQPHLFPGYPVPQPLSIPGYARRRWAFTLIPGWRELADRPLEEVCAWQWIRCNEAVLAHRDQAVLAHRDQAVLDPRDQAVLDHRDQAAGRVPYLTLRYEDLVADPGAVLPTLADFLELDLRGDLGHVGDHLPTINAVTAPDREKWRRTNAAAIERILPLIDPLMHRLGYS